MGALLTIGVPMALAQLVQFSPYIADTLMIGRIGPNEIAAAAIGAVLYFLLWMLANGPIAAVTPLARPNWGFWVQGSRHLLLASIASSPL